MFAFLRTILGSIKIACLLRHLRPIAFFMPIYLKYYFWLVLISLCVFGLERLFPRNPRQEIIRDDLVQDLFWLVFNSQYASWMLALGVVHLASWFDTVFLNFGHPSPETIQLLADWPIWLQFLIFFVLKDFMDWNIHRMLHTVPGLWRFHKLHHSIEQLDWATAFRAHWSEMIIYKFLTYLPLVVLGVDSGVIFALVICALLTQELIHANLPWTFGVFRFLFPSPRFHAWHHDVKLHGKGGQNFAVNLAIWDWLFRTAYLPDDRMSPARLGFHGIKQYPKGIWGRLWDPFLPGKKKPVPTKTKV